MHILLPGCPYCVSGSWMVTERRKWVSIATFRVLPLEQVAQYYFIRPTFKFHSVLVALMSISSALTCLAGLRPREESNDLTYPQSSI